MVAFRWTKKETFWNTAISALCIICFPVNPLVLTGALETNFYTASFVVGWIIWALGIVLVMAPLVLFPRRGGVPTVFASVVKDSRNLAGFAIGKLLTIKGAYNRLTQQNWGIILIGENCCRKC